MGCCAKCDTGSMPCAAVDSSNASAAPQSSPAGAPNSRGFSAKTMDLQFLDLNSIPEFQAPIAQNQSVDPARGGWTLAEGQLFGMPLMGDAKSPSKLF